MADMSRDGERMKKNRRIGLTVAALVFLIDQLVKWVVTYPLQLPHRLTIDVLPFFTLRWLKNTGVSMGLLPADSDLGRWLLVALTCAIAAFVSFWMWREKRRDDAVALSLVLGGALGNILDRARLGYVVDYADLHFWGIHPFLVFNVADAAITIGVLLLLVRALLTREPKAPKEDK